MNTFGAGKAFDDLLDELQRMGCPPPTFGRCSGRHDVYIECVLPIGSTERVATTLDAAARAILDLDLTCPDKDQQAAEESLT